MIQSREVTGRDLRASRRRRAPRTRLIGAAALVAGAAFAVGVVVGVRSGQGPEQRVAARFTEAWERGDWARMWALSGGPGRPRDVAVFAARYRAAAEAATATRMDFGRPERSRSGVVAVPARVE